jgi:hypothetical protein
MVIRGKESSRDQPNEITALHDRLGRQNDEHSIEEAVSPGD